MLESMCTLGTSLKMLEVSSRLLESLSFGAHVLTGCIQTCLGRIHLQLEFKISCSNRSWQEDSYSTSASVTVYRSEILLRHVSKDVIKSRSWRIHPQDSNSLMPALVLMEEEIVCKRWKDLAVKRIHPQVSKFKDSKCYARKEPKDDPPCQESSSKRSSKH